MHIILLFLTIFMIYIIYKYYTRESILESLNDKQKKFLITLTDMADILENNDIHFFLCIYSIKL